MDKKLSMNVKGMHCKSCEMLIKDSVTELDGVKKVDISLAKNTVAVEFDDTKIKEAAIKKAIENEGYKVA